MQSSTRAITGATAARRALAMKSATSFMSTTTSRLVLRRGSDVLKQRRLQQQRRLFSSTETFGGAAPVAGTIEEASAVGTPTSANVTRPSQASLRQLFIASAIPMVGFGAMDNFVMIQAGQYIDSTLGVQLGLATMTAAACGQVVSDVSGVLFGSTVERTLYKLGWVPTPPLSAAQRQLSISRNVSMLGAVLGVIVGCGLGAMTLCLVDLDARERVERAQQLKEILQDMIGRAKVTDEDGGSIACDFCIVHMVDIPLSSATNADGSTTTLRQRKHSLPAGLMDDDTDNGERGNRKLVMRPLSASAPNSTVRHAALARTVTHQPLLQRRWTILPQPARSNDANTRRGDSLYIPVIVESNNDDNDAASEEEVVAVVELHRQNNGRFTAADLHAAHHMARHLAIFMKYL